MEIRPAQREAHCRGCDKIIRRGEDMFATYSSRNRGQSIYFCLTCVDLITAMKTAYEADRPPELVDTNGDKVYS